MSTLPSKREQPPKIGGCYVNLAGRLGTHSRFASALRATDVGDHTQVEVVKDRIGAARNSRDEVVQGGKSDVGEYVRSIVGKDGN